MQPRNFSPEMRRENACNFDEIIQAERREQADKEREGRQELSLMVWAWRDKFKETYTLAQLGDLARMAEATIGGTIAKW